MQCPCGGITLTIYHQKIAYERCPHCTRVDKPIGKRTYPGAPALSEDLFPSENPLRTPTVP